MHKKPKLLVSLVALLLLPTYLLFAQVVVSPHPVVISQPNGTTLTITGKGTSSNPFTETIDGYTLLRNKKGIYVYAKSGKNQQLIPSNLKAHNPGSRTRKEIRCLSKNFKPHIR